MQSPHITNMDSHQIFSASGSYDNRNGQFKQVPLDLNIQASRKALHAGSSYNVMNFEGQTPLTPFMHPKMGHQNDSNHAKNSNLNLVNPRESYNSSNEAEKSGK